MNRVFLILSCIISFHSIAQKSPLDHTVYDSWQSVGERAISNDGKWIAYTINLQECDADLYIRSAADYAFTRKIPRGYNIQFSEDSRYLVLRIKPTYKETREARIKKKRPEDFPKDSFAVVNLEKNDVWKTAKVRSYKLPQKSGTWIAYHKERENIPARSTAVPTQRTIDSLKRTLDSLTLLVKELKNIKGGNRDNLDADEEPATVSAANEGSDLVIRNLVTNRERTFKNVVDYQFNTYGQKLVMRVSKSSRDSAGQNAVILYYPDNDKIDTILKGGNDFRNFAFTESGDKLAFVAERDTAKKALQKFYQLFLYNEGDDSAKVLIDRNASGIRLGTTISENGQVAFSKSGNRLFFGTVPIPSVKDTSLIDIDLVKLDIWHYKDDYLQSQQLFGLQNELRRSHQTMFDFKKDELMHLGSKEFPTVLQTAEGDGKYFFAITDTGRRVAAQWSGTTLKDIYAIDMATGKWIPVKKNYKGQIYPSPDGSYLLLYDNINKQYHSWSGNVWKNITGKIPTALYDEDHDSPSDPSPYGIAGWHQNDSFVYIYDRYDIWQVDPAGIKMPTNLTKGRTAKRTYRYMRLDKEERFLQPGQQLYFRFQDQVTKKTGLAYAIHGSQWKLTPLADANPNNYALVAKAKKAPTVLFTKESYTTSPNLHLIDDRGAIAQLTTINPQQERYNWGNAELYKWKTFTGKESEGILYKPENFDPNKKYPMLIYFYEKVTDGLYNYIAPGPTPSRLNIPFYVSRGYIVFAPDISYTKGHPAKDAYNYIVSGAQALAKNKWVDAKNIGIQGQSWGGYQVMALITQTNMFKAAWAGAPVVNMTSAYGGIRWESGVNRQFQYEKTQSRIGATLWERQDLYLENSPLFHFKKVNTPVVIMSNDADGAVPWYQGIEAFTALRRLNKPVWMLNYNGEAHNLVERKNRKDIQIRQQQYFDWLLKGEKPARWITEGVPAMKKGKDWGLEIVD